MFYANTFGGFALLTFSNILYTNVVLSVSAYQNNSMEHQDRAFLEYVVKSLVDHPEEVKVDRVVDEMGVLITLDVHPEDMGKIIGRSGNTAKAIRTLLRVVGMKHNARVNLKINEPAGSTRGRGSVTADVDAAIGDLNI